MPLKKQETSAKKDASGTKISKLEDAVSKLQNENKALSAELKVVLEKLAELQSCCSDCGKDKELRKSLIDWNPKLASRI